MVPLIGSTSLHREYLRASQRTSVCPWKGIARYYDVAVDGKVNAGAAWYYPDPKPAAARIKDHSASGEALRSRRRAPA